MLRSRAHLCPPLCPQCCCSSKGDSAAPPGAGAVSGSSQPDPSHHAPSLLPQASSSASASLPHCLVRPALQARGQAGGPHTPPEPPSRHLCHSCMTLMPAPAVRESPRKRSPPSHLSLLSPIPQSLPPNGSYLVPPAAAPRHHLAARSCPTSPKSPLSPQSPSPSSLTSPLAQAALSARSLSDCSDLSLLHQQLQHIISRRSSSPFLPDRGLTGFLGLQSSSSDTPVYSLPVPQGHVTPRQPSPLPSPPSPPRLQGRSGHLVGFFGTGGRFVTLKNPLDTVPVETSA